MPSVGHRALVLVGVTLPWLLACEGDLRAPLPPTRLDESFFRCRVQPVVTKLCSQFACHGSGDRYFRVFARNRLRLGGSEAERNALLRDGERSYDFVSAAAFVDEDAPEHSWLLLKPLDEAAGGYFHRGAEIFGEGDVFASKDDPDFEVLRDWARGAKEDPACTEPGQDL